MNSKIKVVFFGVMLLGFGVACTNKNSIQVPGLAGSGNLSSTLATSTTAASKVVIGADAILEADLNCSNSIGIGAENSSGVYSPVTAATVISLKSSESNVKIYSDSACKDAISSITLAAGADKAYFYIESSQVFSPTNFGPEKVTITGTVTSGPALTAGTFTASIVNAADFVPPSDAGVVNVKLAPYNAYGDGVHDDTAAILLAIHSNASSASSLLRDKVIYFPSGTYLVSKQLAWQDASGNWIAYLSFRGQNAATTVIKLANNTPAFSNSAAPLGVLMTGNESCYDNCTPNNTTTNPLGEGNTAYRDHIRNLTVNTGSGNPGAIGIDYVGSNNARVSEVNIVSGDGNGAIGLSMARRYEGPLLVKNVSITGFKNGIYIGSPIHSDYVYSIWMEHIKVTGKGTPGVIINSGAISIRDLETTDTLPAIQNTSSVVALSVIDSSFTGGSTSNSAIYNSVANVRAFVRNTTSSGYKTLINNNGVQLNMPASNEWTSNAPLKLHSTATTSLDLPIEETPIFNPNYPPYPTMWANVETYDANGKLPSVGYDYAPAIQAAIDSGKQNIYLPAGYYSISTTIHLRGSAERLIGFGAHIIPMTNFPATAPALIVDTPTNPLIFIQDVTFTYNVPTQKFSIPAIEHTSSSTLVISNVDTSSYESQPGAGVAFMENIDGGPIIFNGQTAWIRGLNPENSPTAYPTHVSVNGGQVWVLGLKTENAQTSTTKTPVQNSILTVTGGAKVEVLGGWVFTAEVATSPAMVSITNSNVSLSCFSTGPAPTDDYDVLVQESVSGNVRELYGTSSASSPKAYTRSEGSSIPLYIAR